MFNSFIGWLENPSSADKPFMATPSEQSSTRVAFSEALAIDPAVETVVVMPAPTLREPVPSSYLPEEIIKLRSGILDLAIVDDDSLLRLTKICRQSLRRRVERGDLSVKALLAALEPLDSTSKSRVPTMETANKVRAMIRRSILYAMVGVQKQTPGSIPPGLWLAFIDRVCSSNGDNHDVQLFWKLMDALPGTIRDEIPFEQLHNLCSAFITAQANRHNLFAHWSARAARFNRALESLNQTQQGELDRTMATFLRQQDWLSERARRMRFSWLVVKAYDTRATTSDFIQTIRTCMGQDFRLPSLQLWQVLAARLSAVGTLDDEACKHVMTATYTSMSGRWASLIAAAMTSSNGNAGLRELCAILTEIGHFNAVVRVLTSGPIYLLRRDVMEALASACGTHQQALHLYDSLDSKPRAKPRLPLWHWSIWTQHMEQMIKDPSLDPLRIWQVLGLTYSRRKLSQSPNTIPGEIEAKAQFLDKMGQWFLEAPHLNDRQVLRNIEQCARQQRMITNGVSSQTLANMTDIITRDLESGQRGRTSRLQWLLSMVAYNHGQEEAKRTASALNGWRSLIGPESGGREL
jgi:hypothetical protein